MLGDRRIVFGTIRMLFFPPQIRAIGIRKSRAFESEKVSGYIIDKSAYNLPGSRSSPKCPLFLILQASVYMFTVVCNNIYYSFKIFLNFRLA